MLNLAYRYTSQISRWLARPYREVGTLHTDFGALATCTGLVRKENQDRVVIANFSGFSRNDSFTAWLLCDGIGGLKEGDVAAGQAVASIIVGLIRSRDTKRPGVIENVIQEANQHVYNRFLEQGGCTLSLILNSGAFSFATNVGDSRIYQSRDRRVTQLTVDDTIGNQLRLLGGKEINATGGLFSHHLSQYLGIGGNLQLRPVSQFKLDHGDNVILTSDGAHSVDSRVFENIITSGPSPMEIARRLVFVSKWCGGKDNASVICIPSKSSATQRYEPGLLQIWDSFGGLEVLIDDFILSQVEKKERPQQVPTLAANANSKTINLISGEQEIGIAKPRRRKSRGKQEEPNPEIQIIENIEDSSS